MCHPEDITLQGWSTILLDVIYTRNKQLLYGVVSPTGKIYVSGNQGIEAVITSLPIDIINSMGEFVPRLCGFRGPGAQRRHVSSREYNKHATEY